MPACSTGSPRASSAGFAILGKTAAWGSGNRSPTPESRHCTTPPVTNLALCLPSQLAWKCTDPSRKTSFLLERSFLHKPMFVGGKVENPKSSAPAPPQQKHRSASALPLFRRGKHRHRKSAAEAGKCPGLLSSSPAANHSLPRMASRLLTLQDPTSRAQYRSRL